MTTPDIEYTPPVSVISVGACTSVGHRAPTTAASVRSGINRISTHPYMVDSKGRRFIVSHARYLPPQTNCDERLLQLGCQAAEEALEAASSFKEEISVVIGLPPIRQGLSEEMARRIEDEFKTHGPNPGPISSIETICRGHSAGLMAIEKGCSIINKGYAHLCLVGGIDSWIDPDALEWLDLREMNYSNSNPWGFVPGEGAGFCLLASETITRKIPAVAEVLAGVTLMEKNLEEGDAVCTGDALSQAISLVTENSDPVDQIICDLNGRRSRADEFGFAVPKNSGKLKSLGSFLTPAINCGDVGAASGPLFVTLAVQAALQEREKGPLNLMLTRSETGERSAMLVRTLKLKEATG